MNDEIKEILLIIKSCKQDYDKQKNGMHTFDYGELYLLYDYITNLQRERDFYKHMCLKYGRKNYEELYQEKEDYKSRCEKADNQLKIIMQILKEQPNRSIKDDEWLENRLIGVEYILKNGGK